MPHTGAAQGPRAGSLQRREAADVGQAHVLFPQNPNPKWTKKKVWAGLWLVGSVIGEEA